MRGKRFACLIVVLAVAALGCANGRFFLVVLVTDGARRRVPDVATEQAEKQHQLAMPLLLREQAVPRADRGAEPGVGDHRYQGRNREREQYLDETESARSATLPSHARHRRA